MKPLHVLAWLREATRSEIPTQEVFETAQLSSAEEITDQVTARTKNT